MTTKILAAAAAFSVTLAGPVRADWAPEGPITLLIGLAAGGGADTQARLIAEEIEARTGWRIIPEQELRTYFTDTGNDRTQVAFHPENKWMASASTRDGVCLWDLQSGKLLDNLPDRRFEKLVMASPTVLIAAQAVKQAGKRTLCRIPIHPKTGHFGTPRPLLHAEDTDNLAYCPTTHTLAAGSYYGVSLWMLKPEEFEANQDEWPQPSPDSPGQRAKFLQEAASVELPTRAPDQFLTRNDTRYVSLSPDGKYVAAGAHLYREVSIWELSTGKEVKRLHTRDWSFPRFSASGKWLATHDGRSRLWNTNNWSESTTITPSHRPRSIATTISPNDEVLFSADEGHWLRIISTRTGEDLARIELKANIHRLDCSPDGRFLCVLSNTGRLFALNWKRLRQRIENEGVPWEIAIGE